MRTYLPDFRVADTAASEAITVRHLLTHSSGVDAADFAPEDLGRGSDVAAAYVARLADKEQLHAPGAFFSYCNPGFVIAGRIIEVVTNATFNGAFRERVIQPLGLERTFLNVEKAILHRTAIGHFPDPSGGSHRPTDVPVAVRARPGRRRDARRRPCRDAR